MHFPFRDLLGGRRGVAREKDARTRGKKTGMFFLAL